MLKNTEELPIAFTAQSKRYFYCRDAVCAAAFKQGYLPLNPFRVFEYFLGERVDRDIVRRGNNNLIRISDELWVFGIVADGVLFEIEYALLLGKKIRFFTISAREEEIYEVTPDQVKFEPEIHSPGIKRDELLARIMGSYVDPQLLLFDRSPPGSAAALVPEKAQMKAPETDHANALRSQLSSNDVELENPTRAHSDLTPDGTTNANLSSLSRS